MPVIIAKDVVREPLHVVVPLQNPWRWKSRFKHVTRAIKHFVDSGAVVTLVEVAFNRREFAFADSGLDGMAADCNIQGENRFKHKYIGLRSTSELWLKENMIHIGVAAIPHADFNQVAWLDGDVIFARPNWVGEAIQLLQHFSFLQLFSQARDLDPQYQMLPENYPHANGVSFVQSWRDGDIDENLARGWHTRQQNTRRILEDLRRVEGDISKLGRDLARLERDIDEYYYDSRRVFPGLAWACTRKAWEDLGGLPEFAVWGGADWSMAHALIGKRDSMMHSALHPNYKAMMNAWADRADKHIRQNIGVMPGAVFHNWHGKKTVRGYGDKHRILAKVGFDPIAHLKRDYTGIIQLHDDGTDSFINLRDQFRRIARERNEDSIDT